MVARVAKAAADAVGAEAVLGATVAVADPLGVGLVALRSNPRRQAAQARRRRRAGS